MILRGSILNGNVAMHASVQQHDVRVVATIEGKESSLTVLSLADPSGPPVNPAETVEIEGVEQPAHRLEFQRNFRWKDWGPIAGFIHHDRTFSDGGLSGYSNLSGASATITGGNLSVTGASTYRLPDVDPIAPWVAIRAHITSRTGAFGIGIVAPDGSHVLAVHDGTTVSLVEDGTTLDSAAHSQSAPFTITFIITGGNSQGYQPNNPTLHVLINGTHVLAAAPATQYRTVETWAPYRYGFSNISGTTVVSRIVSGFCGGTGIYNPHLVCYEDGSPYELPDGRFVFTGDAANWGDYPNSHNVTFAWNHDSNEIEILGMFFYQRYSSTTTILRWHGCNDIRSRYLIDEGVFLCSWPFADDLLGNDMNNGNDGFFRTSTIFGTVIKMREDIAQLDFSECSLVTNYDVNIQKHNGWWYAAAAEWKTGEIPSSHLARGPEPTRFTETMFSDPTLAENGNFWALRGNRYAYWHHAESGRIVDLDGNLQGGFPFPDPAPSPIFNCYTMVPIMRSGTTYFLFLQNDNTPDPEGGTYYSAGGFNVFYSPLTTTGYEFNRYAAPVLP